MKKLLAFLIVAIVLPLGASAATRDEEIAVLKAQLSLLKSELELICIFIFFSTFSFPFPIHCI